MAVKRSEVYTREEICEMHGYVRLPDAPEVEENRRISRFFREHFTSKGLHAFKAGKTIQVSGEVYWTWVTSRSGPIGDNDGV